ncbi:hypothetical protein E5350_06015 [Lactobacillus johnsonii]|uniref:hypothetical protein n=1 Tax=Lactobacillus johnsonii TaxID=33959 RepID=UPI001093D5E6|nr:hypothetical protein [Lactobacillus johnsonii]TGY28082.1 hypothetical protein E5350_06015 [Lactobacillus johnsonii]
MRKLWTIWIMAKSQIMEENIDDKDKSNIRLWFYNFNVSLIAFIMVSSVLLISVFIPLDFKGKSEAYLLVFSALQQVMPLLFLTLGLGLMINTVILNILVHRIDKKLVNNGNKIDKRYLLPGKHNKR